MSRNNSELVAAENTVVTEGLAILQGLIKRVRQALFEETSTLEDFDFAYNPKIPAPQIRDLAESVLDRLVNSSHHSSWKAAATDPTNAPAGHPSRNPHHATRTSTTGIKVRDRRELIDAPVSRALRARS